MLPASAFHSRAGTHLRLHERQLHRRQRVPQDGLLDVQHRGGVVRDVDGEVEAEGVDGVPQVPHGAVAQAPPPLEVDAEERSVESAESRAAKGGGGSRVPRREWKPGRTWRSKRMSIERRNATSVPRLVMVTPVSVA